MEHAFANLMYDVCQVFGVFKEGSKQRDIRAYSSFCRHQNFFNQRYNEIIEIIDREKIFSKEQRRTFFYKYEMLYNGIMSYPVFSSLSKEQIIEKYLQFILPSFIALDVYKTYRPDHECSFYYHIHHFLLSKHCSELENREWDPFSGVKNYLREYIDKMKFTNKENLYPIYEYIRAIRKDSGQIKSRIELKIDECFQPYHSHLKKHDLYQIKERLNKLKAAYLSLNTLLAFERKTNLLKQLTYSYRHIVLKGGMQHSYYNSLCQYIYTSNHLDEKSLEIFFNEFQRHVINPISIDMDRDEMLDVYVIRDIVFNSIDGQSFTRSELDELTFNLKHSSNACVLNDYYIFSKIINHICTNDLKKASDLLDDISYNTLPIGYLPAAYSMIKIALKIKLKHKGIKNGELLSDINIIHSHQGVFTDYIIRNANTPAPKVRLIECQNNLEIMHTIRQYNSMVRKISYYNCPCHPQFIYGVLNEVEYALKKISERITAINGSINSRILAEIIIDEKILTTRELSKNLISYLSEFTLYNCIDNLEYIATYLIPPGEILPNLFSLSSSTESGRCKRELITDAISIANNIKNNTLAEKRGG